MALKVVNYLGLFVSSSAKLEMLNITFSLIAALFNKTFCNDGNVPYLCGYSALGM